MKVLAYKGKGAISKAIQWQTRSPWSHVAILLDNGETIEAWQKGGVRICGSPGENHAAGTEIAVFGIDYKFDEATATARLLAEVGKKYDFSSVLRFVTRRDSAADNKWFCSELVHAILPFLLARINSAHVSPRDIVLSPYLKFEKIFSVR
jgi:uncharacterized protein YycO